ncbi:probable 2-oxoglutarate-dependent dioxygenase AOP1 [Tripterygium wilfordii]|uniref:probable 2-oxoglutarate-dependent dioxygenase AOP1 n=1 Tax=Tripterygium wilfordii TaxID=458696 RepID=UPI0018F80EBF|nr:probable 2-oxoglutarate-dependent dioxygenase AOP1 [Tripterygium wilfordii]
MAVALTPNEQAASIVSTAFYELGFLCGGDGTTGEIQWLGAFYWSCCSCDNWVYSPFCICHWQIRQETNSCTSITCNRGFLCGGYGTIGHVQWLVAWSLYGLLASQYGDLKNVLDNVADELFSLPKETRKQKTSDKPFHDYFGNYPAFPLYESIPVENPTLGGTQKVTDLMFPAGNDRFSKSVHAFGKLLVELEQLVRRLILESYGIEKYYDSQIESSEYLLRFFKYRIPETNETNAGIPPHTDKNLVSILHQNHVNGLQVKNKDGNWVDLEFSPSSFVFLAAEALVAWSNGRIRSCEHQVIMKAKETRYSMGMFSFNKGNIVVPEELVDDLHPLQYKPFDVYEYLRFSKSEEGMKVNGSIKAFCGVEALSINN